MFKLKNAHKKILIELMQESAKKLNLANSAIVLEDGGLLASAESWVNSSHDATAHSERMLVTHICNKKHSAWTPGLTMISVVEPCLMCMSACSQAGYKEILYLIPAEKYVDQIPYMTDSTKINKEKVAKNFSSPLRLMHLKEYENEFSEVFEKAMERRLD